MESRRAPGRSSHVICRKSLLYCAISQISAGSFTSLPSVGARTRCSGEWGCALRTESAFCWTSFAEFSKYSKRRPKSSGGRGANLKSKARAARRKLGRNAGRTGLLELTAGRRPWNHPFANPSSLFARAVLQALGGLRPRCMLRPRR